LTNWNYQLTHFVTSAPDIRHLPADTGIEVAALAAPMRKSSAEYADQPEKPGAYLKKLDVRSNLFEVAEANAWSTCRAMVMRRYRKR
jgi:GTP-binding protein